MSIISKIKMPGMADAYDIGVDWENVKDKPEVGSIDVGVTNEVLNIDTNNDIAVSGSSNSEIPAWTGDDEFKVLTLTDTNSMTWSPAGAIVTMPEVVQNYLVFFISQLINDNLIGNNKIIAIDEILLPYNGENEIKTNFVNFISSNTGKAFRNTINYHQQQTHLPIICKIGNAIVGQVYISYHNTEMIQIQINNLLFDTNNLTFLIDGTCNIMGCFSDNPTDISTLFAGYIHSVEDNIHFITE